MRQSKTTGGITAKSHHSRKTALPDTEPTTALATVESPENPMRGVLAGVQSTEAAAQGEGSQPPAPASPSIGPVVMAPSEEDPKKQWWYRPADSKVRKLVSKILVLDAAGHDDKAIAKKLKTTAGTIAQYRYLGRKNGWIRTGEDGDEEMVDVEAELAMNIDRKIVRNISASLDGQMTNHQTHEMTIAAAKGRGIFKNSEGKGDGANQGMQVVAIQVIMPTLGAADQTVKEDSVGGVPAYVEGEVEAR
jgi:hypothetical protein